MAVDSGQAFLRGQAANGRLELIASGGWVAAEARSIDTVAAEVLAAGAAGCRAASIDMSRVAGFDTYGARVLGRLAARCGAAGLAFEIQGLGAERLRLYDAVRDVAIAATPEPARPGLAGVARSFLSRLGRAASDDLTSFVSLLGAFISALATTVRSPRSFRFTPLVHQLDRAAWGAVPIILLITFLIGGIIAQQGFFHFRKFGAETYVVDMVGILVLREIGVLIVSIMVAGRSGSSYTAELGSMKMREEIDALKTMGHDPVAVLVVPRVLALVIALPILAFLGSLAALYGGAVIASTYGGMSFEVFVTRLKEAISLTHFKVGMIKAPFMALVIGIVACAEGLKVRGSAQSLGLHTTASVVKSIFLVIVLDGLFAIFFAAIGM